MLHVCVYVCLKRFVNECDSSNLDVTSHHITLHRLSPHIFTGKRDPLIEVCMQSRKTQESLDFHKYIQTTREKIQSLEEREQQLLVQAKQHDQALEQLNGASMEGFTAVRIADRVKELEAKKEKYIAFEYFPPKTQSGIENLRDRMVRMKRHKPLYVDVTWGAGGSTSDTTIELCADAQNRGLTANMHLTCTNMPRDKIDQAFVDMDKHGLLNILALRGDPPQGQVGFEPVESGFSCALDLIKFIKQQNGDKYSISCAGYPEGHPQRIQKASNLQRPMTKSEESRSSYDPSTNETYVCTDEDFEIELQYLKEKVDAGADFVVTQMFFDVQVYFTFVDACREKGITVPILPGIMCITNVGGFFRMAGFCKTRVPPALYETMKKLETEDAEQVKKFGIGFGVNMCQELLDGGRSSGLHFYTLNLDNVVDGILAGIEWGA